MWLFLRYQVEDIFADELKSLSHLNRNTCSLCLLCICLATIFISRFRMMKPDDEIFAPRQSGWRIRAALDKRQSLNEWDHIIFLKHFWANPYFFVWNHHSALSGICEISWMVQVSLQRTNPRNHNSSPEQTIHLLFVNQFHFWAVEVSRLARSFTPDTILSLIRVKIWSPNGTS